MAEARPPIPKVMAQMLAAERARKKATNADPGMGESFDAFAEDLLAERTERPLIIVGSSKIDHLLCEILRTFLLPKAAKVKENDELLEGDRPLSPFSARIKLCYRIGLIDVSLFEVLEKLRAVRNLSAHSIDFKPSVSPLREHLNELKRMLATRKSYSLTKKRYFSDSFESSLEDLQCQLLTICVLLESIITNTKTTSGNPATLKISRT